MIKCVATFMHIIKFLQFAKGIEEWTWTSHLLPFLSILAPSWLGATDQSNPFSISLFSDLYMLFPKWRMTRVTCGRITLCDHSPGNTVPLLCPSPYTNTWVDVVLTYPINTWLTLTAKSTKQSKGRTRWTVCRNMAHITERGSIWK